MSAGAPNPLTRDELTRLRRARDLMDREYTRPLDVPAIARRLHVAGALLAPVPHRVRRDPLRLPVHPPHRTRQSPAAPLGRHHHRHLHGRGLLLAELKGTTTAAVFGTDDLDAVFDKGRAGGAEVLQEPVDQPYGVRDCAFRDPSGNSVRFSQPLTA